MKEEGKQELELDYIAVSPEEFANLPIPKVFHDVGKVRMGIDEVVKGAISMLMSTWGWKK